MRKFFKRKKKEEKPEVKVPYKVEAPEYTSHSGSHDPWWGAR